MREGRKRGVKGWIINVLLAALVFWCFSSAVRYGYPREEEKNYRVMITQTEISGRDAVQMQNQADETMRFTVWGEQENIKVINKELNREAVCSLLTVCGNSELVIEGSSRLDKDDTTGCLLDEAMCLLLFGSTDVLGQTAVIQDKEYAVRGIMHGAEQAVLIETDEAESGGMNRITVEIPKNVSQTEWIRNFTGMYGIAGDSVSFLTWQKLGKLAAGILPGMLFLFIFLPIGRKMMQYRRKTFRFLFFLLAGILLVCFFVWMMGFSLRIPKDFIPARWSDFEFFGNRWEELTKEYRLLFLGGKTQPELRYMNEMLSTVKYSLSAIVLIIIWVHRLSAENYAQAFVWSIFFISLSFFFTVYGGQMDIAQPGMRIIWSAFPVFVWGKYMGFIMERRPCNDSQKFLDRTISSC